MLIFVKLGGSLITDKQVERRFRAEAAQRVASEIKAALDADPDLRLLIGHGSGSFGHVAAKHYGTVEGVHTPEQWRGFAHVATVAAELNHLMAQTLDAAGVPVWRMQPSASALGRDGVITEMALEPDPAGARSRARAAGLRRRRAGRGARRDDHLDRDDLHLSGAPSARAADPAARRSRRRLRRDGQVIPTITPETLPAVEASARRLGGNRRHRRHGDQSPRLCWRWCKPCPDLTHPHHERADARTCSKRRCSIRRSRGR